MRIPKSLGMNWWTTAFISFCAVIGFNLFIISHWRIPFDWTRFVLPLLPLIYVLAVLRSGLPLNHRPGETRVLAHLGLANGITVVRGFLVSVAGLLLELAGNDPLLDSSFFGLASGNHLHNGGSARPGGRDGGPAHRSCHPLG